MTAAGGATAAGRSTVRDASFALLRERGMTTVFGNPGSTELGFLRDFPADFRYVLGLHEGVVVAMADGFAQATGTPAFVNLHSACGVGNAMGAVVNACHNRAPMVITAGNQDRRHLEREPYLFARSTELMAPYVKHSEQPPRAQDVPVALERAWRLASTPPLGPTFVSVPMDDWDAPAPPAPPARVHAAQRLGSAAVEEIAGLLARAARPALVTGAGVDRTGAWKATVQLAERLGAPVWAAPQAPRAGFPEDHELFAGHLAPGEDTAARQLADCDLALVLGAPVFMFLPYDPGENRMPPLIQVTDDPDEAARAPIALAAVADVAAVVQDLLERLAVGTGEARAMRRPPAHPPAPRAPETPLSSPISPAHLMATLAQVLPADAVIVEESPSNRADFRRHLRIRCPGGFYATASGGLGFAMPAAVGIALADRTRPVVCVVGDGSALYAPQALWNAAQLELPVAFVVVNNGRYAILESAARFGGMRDLPSFDLPEVDFASLARSFGCHAVQVTSPTELRAALSEALEGARVTNRPRLVDVAIDPSIPPLLSQPDIPQENK